METASEAERIEAEVEVEVVVQTQAEVPAAPIEVEEPVVAARDG